MTKHPIVSHKEWVAARKDFLRQEKEFTRQREELSQLRRDLPWEKVEKNYLFNGADGEESLADLFDGRSQLIVYHFMFDPDWNEGCKSCSLLADHYEPSIVHLKNRDVTMVTVSRAPLEKLQAFQKRMGWGFKWVSSSGNDFNHDYHVTFTPEEMDSSNAYYNYESGPFGVAEAPGISVFRKGKNGDIFHTYSSYARGLDMFLGVYHLLDIVPEGRDESELVYGMEWVRHHDRYDDETFVDPYVNIGTEDET